ncbi:hypothetical protein [Krasilnikovia sp. M28-CT-15]|uniref:hypothetical protein n=1 Tax=Krasilnikovia sp. M28-CT-15 TaxID=3373540 RepID=UPI00399C6A55
MPLPTAVVFVVYLTLGISLPGLLVWRSVSPRRATLAEDLAAGTALGYAIEVGLYIVGRSFGAPLLPLGWPIAVFLAFFVLPSARIRLARKPVDSGPRWWPWAMAAIVAFVILYSCLSFFRAIQIGPNADGYVDYDTPFLLGIAGELKHHMPPTVPWLAGEPLFYHWFVNAELAATSWATGIELETLLYRLAPLPFLAAFVVLVASLARRLTGQWWTGPVAVVMTFLAQSPNPYGWPLELTFPTYGFGVVEDGGLLRPTMWNSTTQTFGQLIAALLVIVIVDLFREPGGRRAVVRWVMAGWLLVVVMGAKATYVPLLLCGAVLAVFGHALVARRLHRPAMALVVMTTAALCFAQFVLFGGQSQGLSWSPLFTMWRIGVNASTNFVGLSETPLWRMAILVAIAVLCWTCVWVGAFGLLRGRGFASPEILFLLGIGLAGLAAVTVFGHPGSSQYFFLESARPYLCVLSAAGLAALVDAGAHRSGTRTALTLVGAVAGGASVIWFIRYLDGPTRPEFVVGSGDESAVAKAITWPYLAMTGVVVVVAAVLLLTRRRLRGMAWLATLVAFVYGLALPSGIEVFGQQAITYPSYWRRAVELNVPTTVGTVEAGRWLRDHSDPDDLVATNVRCRSRLLEPCAPAHFTVTAYTERRVLIENWAYTSTAHRRALATGMLVGEVPFWDQDMLAANDKVFGAPTAAAVEELHRRYGVRWLFADEAGVPGASAALRNFATLRFRTAHIAVYELR